MAIWQLKTHLIPEQRVRELYGQIPVTIPVDDDDRVQWGDGIRPLPGFEAEISSMLPEMRSWDSSSRMWGDDKNDADFVWVNCGDDNRDVVVEVEFRFHAAEISARFVALACQFAARHGGLFVDNRSRRVMKPDVASVMNGLRKSTAGRFIDDPVATLTNLPKLRPPPEIEMAEVEAPAWPPKPRSKWHRFCAWIAQFSSRKALELLPRKFEPGASPDNLTSTRRSPRSLYPIVIRATVTGRRRANQQREWLAAAFSRHRLETVGHRADRLGKCRRTPALRHRKKRAGRAGRPDPRRR